MKIPLMFFTLLTVLPLAAQQVPPRFGAGPQPATAMEAVAAFKAATGVTRLTNVVEIRGTGGAPTPSVWTVVVHDPASPTRLSEYSVRGPRVEDRRPCQLYYPKRVPEGYFDYGKVTVDSAAAFRAADREAGIARIGFDLIDYRLRCREFSDDPIWDVTMRTADGVALGTVSISNKTGKVLRAVWTRPGPRGALAVAEDSAEPGARPLSTQVPVVPKVLEVRRQAERVPVPAPVREEVPETIPAEPVPALVEPPGGGVGPVPCSDQSNEQSR
ncbi:MAG: hypothetical protein DVB22_002818 [Verrucomicrobia bacterium]|jgi:hypothetical protein|nr:MAG: hypothetical protein DVB22_002818 [Verrucomicrobiota bacterium]